MNIKKLPLSDRLERLHSGLPAHEEYYPSIISDIAHTPITAYMDSFNTDWEPLHDYLCLERAIPDELTYTEAVAYVAVWYQSDRMRKYALEAMRMLAAPLINAGKLFRRHPKEEGQADG